MNIRDILSNDEQVLFSGHEKRWAPGGKEVAPGEFYITSERIIIETNQWMGIKNDFQDIHYSDDPIYIRITGFFQYSSDYKIPRCGWRARVPRTV